MKYSIIIFCLFLISCGEAKKDDAGNWLRANELVNTFEVVDSLDLATPKCVKSIADAGLLLYNNQKAYLVISEVPFNNMNATTSYVEFSIPLYNPSESIEGTYVLQNNEEGKKIFSQASVIYAGENDEAYEADDSNDDEDTEYLPSIVKLSDFKSGELVISQVNDTAYLIKFWMNDGTATNIVSGSYTGKINTINYAYKEGDNVDIEMGDVNSFFYNKYYNSIDDNSPGYRYFVDIIANDVLWPLTVVDENGQISSKERETWEDVFITNNIFNVISNDSVNGNERYKSFSLLNMDENKSYVFHKINDRLMLTRIEPVRTDLDFITFYKKFITDTSYRKEHVKFPINQEFWVLGDLDSDTIYQKNTWDSTSIAQNYRFYERDYYVVSFISDNSKSTCYSSCFYFGEGAFGYDDVFKRGKDGKWYLEKLSEGSD